MDDVLLTEEKQKRFTDLFKELFPDCTVLLLVCNDDQESVLTNNLQASAYVVVDYLKSKGVLDESVEISDTLCEECQDPDHVHEKSKEPN